MALVAPFDFAGIVLPAAYLRVHPSVLSRDYVAFRLDVFATAQAAAPLAVPPVQDVREFEPGDEPGDVPDDVSDDHPVELPEPGNPAPLPSLPPLQTIELVAPYDIAGPNPWVQAYEYLKSLPEYAGAADA